jgi:hypothetical protein
MQPIPFRVLRIILFALMSGVALLAGAGYALKLFDTEERAPTVGPVLSYVSVFALAAGFLAASVLRTWALARARADRDASLEFLSRDRVPPVLASATILGAGIVEGTGLLGGVSFIAGASIYVLAVPAIAIVLIATMIPSRERLEQSVRESA